MSMDPSTSRPVAPRLHYRKCTRCRKDKKKCLPVNRSWPGQKCERCAEYNYACSASMTAKEDRELQQSYSAVPRVLPFSNISIASYAGFAMPNSQQPRTNIHPEHQSGEKAPPYPLCAPYFSTLIRFSFACFGLTAWPKIPSFDLFLLSDSIDEIMYRNLHYTLNSRLNMVNLGRRCTSFLQEGQSQGLSPWNVQAYANGRMLSAMGKETRDPVAFGMNDGEAADFVRDFDGKIRVALRWAGLLDAVGVPEVLLIDSHMEEGRTHLWGGIPRPDIASVSDEEWPFLLSRLLSPELRLKETCFGLSGVADMIQQLQGLDAHLDLWNYLIDSIFKRVRDMLGDMRSLSYEDDGEDDESMADADT